tara:strand:+ start:114 stop:308 length:195 start_codon:yes stop_codon:yes gene_type:complete
MLNFLYKDNKILGWTEEKILLDTFPNQYKSIEDLPNYRDLFLNDDLLVWFLNWKKERPKYNKYS